LKGGSGSDDNGELIEIIQTSTDRLDRYLDRMNLLYDFDHIHPVNAPVLDSVDQAVALATRTTGLTIDNATEVSIPDRQIIVPRSSLILLVEAILYSHLDSRTAQQRTEVDVRLQKAGTVIRITTTDDSSAPMPCLTRHWQTYTRQLAHLMGINVTDTVREDKGQSTTETKLLIADRQM